MTADTIETTVKVGDFFAASWGYDQTNVDFYRVEAITPSGKTVKVARWSSQHVTDSSVIPGDVPIAAYDHGTNHWLEAGDTLTKRLRTDSGRPSFYVASYADARLWQGKPMHETPIGQGH